MNMKKIFIYLLPALLALSCTTSPDYVVDKGNKGDKVEVCFGQSINIGSRISIGDNGSASWTKGDKIALWAQKSDGSFEMANQTFSLHHFSSTFDTAIFSSLITPLTEQSYTYYATYPVPESVDGNIARFNLPAIQNGGSELGVRDIMVARPATGAALTEDEYANLNLGFTHKMHTLRLQLEDTQLNGVDIEEITLEFPTAVVGDVSVDITDPYATPTLTNSLDYVTISVPEDYTAGDYLWVTIFPTTITGDISYRISAGEYTSKQQSISIDKEAKPQRVTPLSMPIPEPITTIYIAVTDSSKLGEEFDTMDVMDSGGNIICSFQRDNSDIYYLPENVTLSSNQPLTIGYGSENAYVTANVTVPTILAGKTHRIESEVPYLLYEDFSTAKGYSQNDGYKAGTNSDTTLTGYLLDGYMSTNGWNASRFQISAGNAIRINVRYQSGAWVVERYCGRLDTPALKGIRPNKNVSVKLMFDIACYVPSGYNANDTSNAATAYAIATHTSSESSAIKGVTQGNISAIYTSPYFTRNVTSDTFNCDYQKDKSINISGCGNSTRITWYPITNRATKHIAANGAYYIYIDNIRVSIAK